MISIIGAGVVGRVFAKALETGGYDYQIISNPDSSNSLLKGEESNILGDIFRANSQNGSLDIWGGVLYIDRKWFKSDEETNSFLRFVLKYFQLVEVYNYKQDSTVLHAKCVLRKFELRNSPLLRNVKQIVRRNGCFYLDEECSNEVILATGAVSTPIITGDCLEFNNSTQWQDKFIDLVPCSTEEFIENVSVATQGEETFVDVPVYLPLGHSVQEKKFGFKVIMFKSGLYKLRISDLALFLTAFRVVLNLFTGKRNKFLFRTISHKSNYPVKIMGTNKKSSILDNGVMLAYHPTIVVIDKVKSFCISEFEGDNDAIVAGNPVAKRIFNIWIQLIQKGYFL